MQLDVCVAAMQLDVCVAAITTSTFRQSEQIHYSEHFSISAGTGLFGLVRVYCT